MASKYKLVRNRTAASVLAEQARIADTFGARLAGLLFSDPLTQGQGLWIEPCSSIHMIGMKFSIDAVFVNCQHEVVGLAEGIAPGQLSRIYPSARACLELPAGTIYDTNTKLGDKLELLDA